MKSKRIRRMIGIRKVDHQTEKEEPEERSEAS